MPTHPEHDLSIRRIENEIFIYDSNRSLIHTFNATGVFLWDQIEKGLSREEIIANLTDTYTVDQSTAENDVDTFFTALRSAGLIP